MDKKIKFEQITSLEPEWIKTQIDKFILEDCPNIDTTTEYIFNNSSNKIAEIISVDNFIFCGARIIPFCFPESCKARVIIQDGEKIDKGTIIAKIFGPVKSILTYERIVLNLLQKLCGIATETRKYCNMKLPKDFKVMDTRKTTPGLRLFEKYAVNVGGGWNHRLNLSSAILIKDNHIQAAGSIQSAVRLIREKNKNQIPIELEVDTLDQIKDGLEVNVDGFLLDNMAPDSVRKAVKIIRESPDGESIFIEASGGINNKTLESYAWTGIDGVSMSAITFQAQPVDIKLEIK